MEKPTQEEIQDFLHGNDPEKYIVAVEYGWRTNKIYKIIEHPEHGKVIKTDTFIPFCWVGDLREKNFYKGSKALQKEAMSTHGIMISKLDTKGNERLENGLQYLVKTTKTYRDLVSFFKKGGLEPWSQDNRDSIQILSPVEQYLIQKEKRLFKGFEDYNDVHRFVFDLETTSLLPEEGRIFMIGMKDNRGYERVIEIPDNDESEKEAIYEFFDEVIKIKPSMIGGYNSANFDWDWLFKRAEILRMDTKRFKTLNPNEGYKMREGTLKLGAEMETYSQVNIWGVNSIDIAHSVRRAQTINSSIKSWGLKYITKFSNAEKPNRVYVPGDKIASTYKENKDFYLNVDNGEYRSVDEKGMDGLDHKFPNVYKRVGGEHIVEQYLLDDLWETMVVDEQYNQASFLLAGMMPTTYQRVSTMGTATLWKTLMLAWSYKYNLAIPAKESKRPFVGGLSRLVKTGYSTNVLKLDFSSLYPSIQLVHNVFPDCDVTHTMESMLKYFRDTRIKYKKLASQWYQMDKKKSESFGRKQLPIKIFINSMFGSLSAPHVFPWGDMDMGEKITCTGRQYLRQLVRHFMSKGYDPLVMDTDGVNFSCPKDVDVREYVGLGNNELVTKDVVYKGSEADVAEYNDLFMRGEMGLDTDGQWPSCINVARKNYALLTDTGKVKLTGNSIKSKKIQGYMETFIDVGLRLLLEGKGAEFVEYYYDYLQEIYDMKIPLIKIANKARVKQSLKAYKTRCKQRTKSGSLMARQAHMELAIENNLSVSLGDTIHYVNNGKAKSHGDVQKKKKKGEPDKIVLNCYLVDENELTEDKLGEYNVARYVSIYNKRVEPLLVCFKPEVRDSLLKTKPEDREFFTKTQCELINGIPRKEADQDKLDEILTLSPEEQMFWDNMGLSENSFMEELGIFESVG